MTDIEQTPAWRALAAHAQASSHADLNTLFAQDPARANNLRVQGSGLLLDYSKQRLTPETRDLLLELARSCDLPQAIAAMFVGEHINKTEDRAAWHVALRAPRDTGFPDEVHTEVHKVLDAMAGFTDNLRSGLWRGYTGETITDVVNIGIGGSDLGPRMVCRALAGLESEPAVHFVASVDPQEMHDMLSRLDPARSLFIVTSKSFTTAETLANASAARDWLRANGAGEEDIAKHFVAVSTNAQAVADFGIDTANMFGFWDWVGGRFSLWSAVGLSISLALGTENLRELLSGAHAMDEHFRSAPLQQNLPVMLALVGIWNRNFLNMPSLVVAPYAQRLEHFPAWLQQLEMESNGKSTAADGSPVAVATAPAIWGSVGTNAQHAYFQMLHQGSDVLPVDFILSLAGDGPRRDQLVANCLAQAEALMTGKSAAQVRAQGISERLVTHRSFAGNRPSNMLVLEKLDARNLGALLAAYEHKTYVQGVIWGINSFDQWGVELGKVLAERILDELQEGQAGQHDASTQALIDIAKRPADL